MDSVLGRTIAVISSNASRSNGLAGQILQELRAAMELLHGDGTAVDILGILKRFFAQQILLLVQNDLPDSTVVSEELVSCAAGRIIQEPLASTLADISAKLTQQLRAVYTIRKTVIDLYFLAENLELEGAPFTECIRAYAELNYCQVCQPIQGYPNSRPCQNVCRNVMIGCSGYLHQFREAVTAKAREALDELAIVQMEANGFQQTIERIGEELKKLDGSFAGEGASIARQVCAKPVFTACACSCSYVIMPILTWQLSHQLICDSTV